MFTEGTPWGAILNPTLGALIKPEREEHPGRVRNGIDIVALLHNANESIRQRAKDYTNTNYLMMKDGQVSAVDFNVWNAPTPDTKIMTVQPNGELAAVYGGTYGIYGTGGKDYSFGSSGGTALGMYAAHTFGRAPGGGIAQNLSAGFNSFDDIATANENSPYITPVLNKYVLAPAEERSVREAAYEGYFGGPGPYSRHGDIIQNEKGELGIYLNRPVKPMRGGELTDEEQLAVDAVIKHQGQAERLTLFRMGVANSEDLENLLLFGKGNLNSTNLVRNLNDALKVRATQHIDSPYAIDESQGFVTGKKLSSYNPSQAMDLINDADTVADLINEGHGSSFVRNASTSIRLIGGIYGYMASEAVGFGVHNEKVAADSSDMYGFNKNFWDLDLGGLGGAVSEIGRRFIPNFQRMSKINPLMNQMPDWLPERFRYGDPYCVTFDTLIETDNLQFIHANEVEVFQQLTTHTGKKEQVQGVAVRPIGDQEKLYRFKISSLSAVQSTYSENHPILVHNQDDVTDSKGHVKQDLSKLARYNDIIRCLMNGITLKKEISFITGINIDWLYVYLKDLQKLGMIENYKEDKYRLFPIMENLKLFDLNLIGHRLEWRKAKDIRVGDYVAYPLPEYIEGTVIIDLAEITNYVASEKYIYTSGQCKHKDFVEAYEWLEKQKYIPVFQHGQRKQFLEEKGWSAKAYEAAQGMVTKGRQPERMQRFVELTPELCYAVGLYLAEGYHNSSGICYTLHIKEQHFFERCVKAVTKAGFNITRYHFKRIGNTNGAEGTIFCKVLMSFMDYLVGKLAHHKRLNDLFWNLKKDNLLRFLEGYIDGDGYNHIIKSGANDRDSYRVGISSCNLVLLLQIRKLALRFGVIFRVQEKGIPKHSIFINGHPVRTGINYSANVIGEAAVRFAKELWGVDIQVPEWKKQSPRHSFIYDNYIYMRVQDIQEFTQEDYPIVYGFEMQADESFCTAGVATHNTKLPKGEMRLPGPGFLSMNELHPDMFSTERDPYGSFDRMKILADIAPNSPEYKLWREIAQHTVTDPYLQDEMEEIKSRARQQGKKHDFYNYQVVGKGLDYKNVVVSEVLGYGKFRSGDTIYKIAGISVKGNAEESAQEVLERYLAPGQEVTIAVDSNQYYAQNKDLQRTINAAVYIGGESLGETMKEAGDADVRKGDKSAAATLGNLTAFQRVIGYAGEIIGHLDIPIISDQWMRIRSPYESYLAEQIYGTPYQSWAHPINTFLWPAIERAVHERSVVDLITSEAFTYIRENERTPEFKTDILGVPIEIKSRKILRNQKQFLHTASILSNRSTLVGYAIANMLDAENAKLAVPLAHGLNTVATIAHMATGGTSVLDMAAMGAYAGREVFNFMEYTGTRNRNKFIAAGAAAGAALRMLLHPTGDQWIPDRVKKNWDMQDYWATKLLMKI